MTQDKLLEVRDLRTYFFTRRAVARAVDGVSFAVGRGEGVGIVGESGCGKTVTALSILGLVDRPGRRVSGEILFEGRDLCKMGTEQLRRIRGREIAMIFQNPVASFNPVFTVGRQLTEAVRTHTGMSKHGATDRAAELLELVGIGEPRRRMRQFPHQFSGGMAQRAMIAMALSCQPKMLIADEPTTALDVTVRAQILNLIQAMKEEFSMSVIIITHDFGMATNFCDRIIVMYAGQIVESAPTMAFVESALHPYSQGLLRSTLDVGAVDVRLQPIPGNPPNLIAPPPGCRFHPRCAARQSVCEKEQPALVRIDDGHEVACHLVGGGASRV